MEERKFIHDTGNLLKSIGLEEMDIEITKVGLFKKILLAQKEKTKNGGGQLLRSERIEIMFNEAKKDENSFIILLLFADRIWLEKENFILKSCAIPEGLLQSFLEKLKEDNDLAGEDLPSQEIKPIKN
jgi:hypothetical protein